MKKIFTRKFRGWIYGVAITAIPVLVHYGIMEKEAMPLMAPLLLALLNLTPEEAKGRYRADD